MIPYTGYSVLRVFPLPPALPKKEGILRGCLSVDSFKDHISNVCLDGDKRKVWQDNEHEQALTKCSLDTTL